MNVPIMPANERDDDGPDDVADLYPPGEGSLAAFACPTEERVYLLGGMGVPIASYPDFNSEVVVCHLGSSFKPAGPPLQGLAGRGVNDTFQLSTTAAQTLTRYLRPRMQLSFVKSGDVGRSWTLRFSRPSNTPGDHVRL